MHLFGPGDLVDLGPVRLRSVHVRGEVGELERTEAGGRDADTALADSLGRAGVPEAGAAALAVSIADAGARIDYLLPLWQLEVAGETPHLLVEVETPGEEEGQFVMEVDEAGVLRWHLPDPHALADAEPAAAQGPYRFTIPVERVDTSPPGELSFGRAKVLHVLRFSIEGTGPLQVAEWERRFRPYGTAFVTPETLGQPIDGQRLTAEEWERLDRTPTLMLVHGTFSRARSAFHGLAAGQVLLGELWRRYEGRVIAFDHPTLHVSPESNAAEFAEQVPPGVELTLDVLAHSRGGLVARHLAAFPGVASVRLTVHVATPNAGTPLASPEHIRRFLDTLTNLLILAPSGPVTVVLSGIVEVLRQLATGTVGGLDGLAAMDPEGKALQVLNRTPAGPQDCAIASDFEAGESSALLLLDLMVDAFFGSANDLIVPTAGVATAGLFRVADSHTVPVARAVTHNGFFQDSFVLERLAARLSG